MMEATQAAGPGNVAAQPKRRLRNFLLDKGFQLRWVLRVVCAASLIVVVMGYFLYGTVADATDQILLQKVGDPALTEEALNAFQEQASRDKTATMWVLIGGLVTIVVLLGGLTIVATHKIAGPVYKMRKLFASIDGRNLQLWAKLRKADELQEAFVDFDNMIRRIREHRREDIEQLRAIHGLIAEDPGQAETARKLADLIAMHEKSVRMD